MTCFDRVRNVAIFRGHDGKQDQLIANADLVTEMQEIKHYYHKGVVARRGIES